MLVLDYNYTSEIAHDFAKLLNLGDKNFTPRPFNRNNFKDTVWWVIPGVEWPAYKYGKYIFKSSGDRIYCGFNIEKVPQKGLKENIEDKSSWMQDLFHDNIGWQWGKFAEDMENKKVDKIVRNLIKKYKDEIRIEMGISYNVEKVKVKCTVDTHASKFIYSYGDKCLKLNREETEANDFLEFKNINSIDEAGKFIKNEKEINWCWMDFNILIPFKRKKHGTDNNKLIDEYKLGNILKPLDRWVL